MRTWQDGIKLQKELVKNSENTLKHNAAEEVG